jgi:hypothetical protein
MVASCFAHLNARAAAKAQKDFLRREITFDDLEYLDVNDDGKGKFIFDDKYSAL